MMIKIILSIILIFVFSVSAHAETISLYASVDDSSGSVNMLGDLMRNDPEYDPFNEYVICRTGERDYRLYFGKDLDEFSICYIYQTSAYNVPATLSRRSVNDGLNINKNGYWYVGNIDGSLASQSIDTYKTNYVLVVLLIVITLFVIFKVFRRHQKTHNQYYSVR